MNLTANASSQDVSIVDVQQVLFLRFKVPLQNGKKLVEEWLKKHPNESCHTLKQGLLVGQIFAKHNESLLDLRQRPREELLQLELELRGEGGVEIKDRRYKLKKYRCCCVGSEVVMWLQQHLHVSLPEAVRWGELLAEHQVLHHVLDQHDFKNEFLFYRFYKDEPV